MLTYIAQVTRDGAYYTLSYPDLPGAYAQADTLQSLPEEAQRALCEYLYDAELTGTPVAPPSSTLPTPEDDVILLMVTVDMDSYRERVDAAPVRKTVSLPSWMVARAERMGLSLSKVLQESLRSYFR